MSKRDASENFVCHRRRNGADYRTTGLETKRLFGAEKPQSGNDLRHDKEDTGSAGELKHRRNYLLSRKTGPSQTPVAELRVAGGGDKMTIMFDWSDCTGVTTSPDTVSGAFVFRGTRVPVKALFENLEDGATVDDFIQWFPGVSREQVDAVLE